MPRLQYTVPQGESSALLTRINKARTSANLDPLFKSQTLETLASTHAASLARTKILRPSSVTLNVRYGENLHQCGATRPASDAFAAWKKKKCARENMFTPFAKFVGLGIAVSDDQAFVAMLLTKESPDKDEGSEFGSIASCTTQATVACAETDVVTQSEWPMTSEYGGKENEDPQGQTRLSVSKALDIAHDAFNYMNGARRDAGVHYLRWDDGLYRQALTHTERIFRLGRLLHSGKRRFENVAKIDLESSKKHGKVLSEKFMRRRENMLSSSFEYCAIAVVGNGEKVFATQLFSRERVG